MSIRIAATVAALMLAAAPAQAKVNTITLTGGSAFTNGGTGVIVAQPASFAATGFNLNGFNERQNVVLALGNLSPRGSVFDVNGLNLTTVSDIVSAVPVSSHFFYITPTTGGAIAMGQITFNQNVIAVQRGGNLFAAPRSAQLHNGVSNFATLASSPGTEAANDVITLINPKTISYSLNIGTGSTDAFRVLTAVPEPGSWVLMVAGFGLVGLARRRKVAVAA